MVQFKENSNNDNKCTFERQTAEYADRTGRFAKEGDNYTKQFASIYVRRLEELSIILKEKLKAKWGNYMFVKVLIYFLNILI